MKVLMHHSQRAARSFVRGLEIRLKEGLPISILWLCVREWVCPLREIWQENTGYWFTHVAKHGLI